MMFPLLRQIFATDRRASRRPLRRRRQRQARLDLERLEGRATPAIFMVMGTGDATGAVIDRSSVGSPSQSRRRQRCGLCSMQIELRPLRPDDDRAASVRDQS